MDTTLCKVIIDMGINHTDRELLARVFSKLDITGEPYTVQEGTIEMVVDADTWSALYVLEDLGVLRAEQI